jgi:hypothetical protein
MDLFRLASGKMENFWDDQVLVREQCIKHLMKADNADTDYGNPLFEYSRLRCAAVRGVCIRIVNGLVICIINIEVNS